MNLSNFISETFYHIHITAVFERLSHACLFHVTWRINSYLLRFGRSIDETQMPSWIKPGSHMSPMIGESLSVIIQVENSQRISLMSNH